VKKLEELELIDQARLKDIILGNISWYMKNYLVFGTKKIKLENAGDVI
jgi:hypothetical protein